MRKLHDAPIVISNRRPGSVAPALTDLIAVGARLPGPVGGCKALQLLLVQAVPPAQLLQGQAPVLLQAATDNAAVVPGNHPLDAVEQH